MNVPEQVVKKSRSRQRQRQNRKLARLGIKGTKLFSNLYDGLSTTDVPPNNEVCDDLSKDKSLQRTALFFIDVFQRDRRPADDKLLQLSLEHAGSHKDFGPFLRASHSIWDAEFRARGVDSMPFSSLTEMARFTTRQEARLHFYRQQLANALRLEAATTHRRQVFGQFYCARRLRIARNKRELADVMTRAAGACNGLYVSTSERKCWTCRMHHYNSWEYMVKRISSLYSLGTPTMTESTFMEPIFYGHALCIRMIRILERLLGRMTARLDRIRSMQEHYHNGCASLGIKLEENNVTHKMRLPEWDPTSGAALSWPHRVIQKLELAAKDAPMARYARKELTDLTEEAQSIRRNLGGREDTESEKSEVE